MLLTLTMVISVASYDTKTVKNPDSEDTGTTVNKEITFEEISVVDNDGCVIKITGIDAYNLWGYTLSAYLENKSAEKTYMFSVESASVNGVQTTLILLQQLQPEIRQMKISASAIHPWKKTASPILRISNLLSVCMTPRIGRQTTLPGKLYIFIHMERIKLRCMSGKQRIPTM